MRTSSTFIHRLSFGAVIGATILSAACTDDSRSPVAPQPHVTFGKGGPTPSGPNSLPERGRIVFTMYDAVNSRTDLYSANEDGSAMKRLTYSPYGDMWPAGSRDGKKIAYVAERDGTLADVIVMNADGSLPRTITSTGMYDYMFSRMEWSPDGKSIVTSLNPTGDLVNWDLYLINATNGSLTQLTSFPGFESYPSWSPDGTRIAFHMADANGITQVFTMRRDGTDLAQFTFCATSCSEPSWSPDGQTISTFDFATNSTIIRSVGSWTTSAGSLFGRYAVWAPDAARLVFQNYDPAHLFALSTASFTGASVQHVRDGEGGLGIATWLRK